MVSSLRLLRLEGMTVVSAGRAKGGALPTELAAHEGDKYSAWAHRACARRHRLQAACTAKFARTQTRRTAGPTQRAATNLGLLRRFGRQVAPASVAAEC